MRTLAVVPARGGSKGLPGKNARPFLGVPLIVMAISIAQETCDDVIVTTDDPELARLATNRMAAVRMRPPELATDEASMLPVVQDAIRGREGDAIVLLQPTQPLRTVGQVNEALALLAASGAESVVSVKEVPEAYLPDRMVLEIRGRLCPVDMRNPREADPPRRQDARRAYVRDGTVYAVLRQVVEARGSYRGSLYGLDCRPLILPGDALSIDTLKDFERLEAMARGPCFRCGGVVSGAGLATRSDAALYAVVPGLPPRAVDANIWLCVECARIASSRELARRYGVPVVT